MGLWVPSVFLLTFGFVLIVWSHHCVDPDNPYMKASDCDQGKIHFCYNLVEDMESFTCRCADHQGCREACGMNIFRAWSSPNGSWISKFKRDSEVPSIGVEAYVQCTNVPDDPQRPHKLPYTMCMCSDHYFSYDYHISSGHRKNFSRELSARIQRQLPKMYVMGSEYQHQNLPYVNGGNFMYRKCRDVSVSESYKPADWLGTHWCNQKFCEENNPFGRDQPNRTYIARQCAEACTCFLEPNEDTLAQAKARNELFDSQLLD